MLNFSESENEFYLINPFNVFRLSQDRYFVSTFSGNYSLLTEEELKMLKTKKLDGETFQKLEKDGVIITKNNFRRLVRNIYFQKITSRLCKFFVYSITRRCTNACIYCHAGSSEISPKDAKQDMDRETAKLMLEFIATFPYRRGEKILLVTEGGEPLLNFETLEFIYEHKRKVESRKKIKIVLDVVTNLVPMNEEIAKTFMKWYKNNDFRFCSSLDGPRKIHDYHRPLKNGKGTYEIVRYWFEYFKKEYKYIIPFIPVVTSYTLRNSTPKDLLEEYLKFDNHVFFYKIFRPTGVAKKRYKELEVDAEGAVKFWIELIEEIIRMRKKGKRISERITNLLVANIETPLRFSMCHRKPCGCGFDIITIEEKGWIIGCDALRSISHKHILGHVRQDDFYSILKRALGFYFSNSLFSPLCDTCAFNPFCNVCLSSTIGHLNTWHPEPGIQDCKIYKKIFEYLLKLKYFEKEKWEILKRCAQETHCYRWIKW